MATLILESIGQMNEVFADIERVVGDMDYSFVLEQSLEDIAAGEKEAFDAGTAPGGGPWAPLAPSTIKRKGHAVILYETGDLERSLVEVDGPGNIAEASARGLVFGTDIEYALFHDTGTSRMPQRQPVGVSEETIDKIANRVADETVRILVESGQ